MSIREKLIEGKGEIESGVGACATFALSEKLALTFVGFFCNIYIN